MTHRGIKRCALLPTSLRNSARRRGGGAETILGVLHRLLQREGIIFAGLQLVQDLLVVFLPSL